MTGAVAAAGIGGSLLSSKAQSGAASEASEAQVRATEIGVAEQRRQFDKLVELMSPYVAAGPGALEQQQAIIGLGGPEAQQAAIAGIEASPLFQSMTQQGEEAMLQRASATGGLRGGDIQGALAQYRPQILNQLIEQQYGRLGGLTGIGQSAAAGQAAAGQQLGAGVSGLYQQAGQAQAQGALAQGRVQSDLIGSLSGIGGKLIGGMF